jgi:hypothetical protein
MGFASLIRRRNTLLGAALGAKMERARRLADDDGHWDLFAAVQGWYESVAGPYEDRKIEQNGDVY